MAMRRCCIYKTSGFTLVELLVVIAIVGVLVAMMVPTLTEARGRAQQVTCASQERQILIGFAGYLNDWKRTYPFANPSDPAGLTDPAERNSWPAATNNPWMYNLRAYLGNYARNASVKVLQCPRNPWPHWVSTTQNSPATSYGMNTNGFPGNFHSSVAGFPLVAARTEDKVLQPSRVLLLGENPNGLNTELGRSFASVDVTEAGFRSAVAYSAPASAGGYWYTDEIAGRSLPSAGNPVVRVNHKLGWNSGMADGSVKFSSKAQLRTWADQGTVAGISEGAMFWHNR